MINNIIKHSIVTASLLLAAATAQAQSPQAEVPFTVLSTRNVSFAKPLQLQGPGTSAKAAMDKAFMIRVEVPVAAYDALPPSMEPYLYIGDRELRTYSVERPRGGKTVFVTYYLRGAADTATFDAGAPMVITIDHGRPMREAALYRSRKDLKTFDRRWLPRR